MNIEKYRKNYLQKNWGNNCFTMVKYKLNTTEMISRFFLQSLDETIIISNEWKTRRKHIGLITMNYA